jgi:hypothetical protein
VQDRTSAGGPRGGAEERCSKERKCRGRRDIEVDDVDRTGSRERLAGVPESEASVAERGRAGAPALIRGGVQMVEPDPAAEPRVVEEVTHEGWNSTSRRRSLSDDQDADHAGVGGPPRNVRLGATSTQRAAVTGCIHSEHGEIDPMAPHPVSAIGTQAGVTT